MGTEKPIIVIVGPTASGKSDMAMKLAYKYDGEIVCADSRTIYREMNIGTAKPTEEDQNEIKHHCLNLVNPSESFSAAEFKRCALSAIKTIRAHNKIPFIVGGSGLYIDGLLYDFNFSSKSDPKLRRELEAMDLDKLQTKAKEVGISQTEINFKNKRHLIRAIERGGVIKDKKSLSNDTLILGIELSKFELHRRIETRIDLMLESGIETEVRNLLDKYGENAPGLLAPGYKAFIEHIKGAVDINKTKIKFIQNDKNLAKRQMTWFKRNKDIKWIKNYPEAEKQVADFLIKFGTMSK